MPGNRVLISLNLSSKTRRTLMNVTNLYFMKIASTGNQISEEGMEAFLLSMQYQLTLTSVYKNQAPGLLRLDLTVS
jgi:hypothetical protein